MPREIIQSLIIFILLIVTPRIIITIFDFLLQNRTANLQIQKYTLEEIVEDHKAVDIVKQIKEFLEKAPNLNKIREDNWELKQIKLKTEILLRKLAKRIQKRKKSLSNLFEQNDDKQTKSKSPKMQVTPTRRIAGLQNHLLGGVSKEQVYCVTYHEIPDEQWNKEMAKKRAEQ